MFELAIPGDVDLVIVGGGAGKGASSESFGVVKDQSRLVTQTELKN